MIKKEIYKLVIHPLFFISTILIFVITIGLNTYYGLSEKGNEININTQGLVQEYSSIQDVQRLLERTNEEIDNVVPDTLSYEKIMNSLEYRKHLYEHILDEYIPYDQLVDIGVIASEPQNSYYSFHSRTSAYLMIAILLYIIVINYCVFSIDFDNESYKYLYSGNVRRKRLVSKMVVTIVVILAMSILICAIQGIYGGLIWANDTKTLADFSTGKLIIISKTAFAFLNSLSLLFFVLAMSLLVTGIFYIFKKSIYSFIASFLYIIAMNSLNSISRNDIVSSIFQLPVYSYTSNTLWYTIGINLLISCLVLGVGIRSVLKKNL